MPYLCCKLSTVCPHSKHHSRGPNYNTGDNCGPGWASEEWSDGGKLTNCQLVLN